MWHESERNQASYYSVLYQKSLEQTSKEMDHIHLKRLKILAQLYVHPKVKYLPWFVRPKYLCDGNNVLSTSGDPNYDPSTLHIPIEEYKYFTPTMI